MIKGADWTMAFDTRMHPNSVDAKDGPGARILKDKRGPYLNLMHLSEDPVAEPVRIRMRQ